MHEFSIAEDLVRRVSEVLEQYPGSRPIRITVAVGAYSGVDSTALDAAFPFAAEGTPVRDAELVMEPVAPSFSCRRCGDVVQDAIAVSCPSCGSAEMALQAGRELELVALEIVSDEAG